MKTALVFPGQGSQIVGMGRDLYQASSAARVIFEEADDTLGFALSELCFEGPEEKLTATENAQPAILTVSIALLVVLAMEARTTGIVSGGSSFVAGHSLGKFSALVSAKALDFASALKLVRRRGELMASADQGTMAAVIGLSDEMLEQVCHEASTDEEPVVIANYNAPGQLVISGATASVEKAVDLARARGAKRVLPLKVNAAFHSPLMREAASGLAEAASTVSIKNAQVPVVSNVTATPLKYAPRIRRELAVQVTAPVRWIASVQHMVASGVDTFVEVGPGRVLTGLIKRIAPEARLIHISSLQDIRAFVQKRREEEAKLTDKQEEEVTPSDE